MRYFIVVFIAFSLFFGCKKKSQTQQNAANKKVALNSKKAPVATETIKAKKFPDDLMFFGGLKSLKNVENILNSMAKNFPNVPQIQMMFYAGLQSAFMLKNMDWLKKDMPLYFASFKAKTSTGSVSSIVLFPADLKKFKMALPDKVEGNDKDGYLIKTPHSPVFIKFIGDKYIAISDNKDFINKKLDFVKNYLSSLKISGLVDFIIPLSKLSSKLDKSAVESFFNMYGSMLDVGTRMTLRKLSDPLLKFIKDIDTVKISINYDKGVLSIPVSGTLVDGSNFSKKFKKLSTIKITSLKFLPADSYFIFGSGLGNYVDVKKLRKSLEEVNVFMNFSKAELDKLIDIIKKFNAVSTGESSFAISKYKNFPLNFIGVASLKNSKQFEATLKEIWDFTNNVLIKKISELAASKSKDKGTPPAFKFQNFDQIIAFVNPMIQNFGMSLETVNKKYGNGKYFGILLKIDYSKIPPTVRDNEKAMIKSVIGSKLSLLIGFNDKGVIYTFSPAAEEIVKDFLDGKLGSTKNSYVDSDIYKSFLDSNLFFTLSLKEIINALSFIPEVKKNLGIFAGLNPKDVIYFYLKINNNSFTSLFKLPVEQIIVPIIKASSRNSTNKGMTPPPAPTK